MLSVIMLNVVMLSVVTPLKRLVAYKRSSLFCRSVSDEESKFCDIDTRLMGFFPDMGNAPD